MTNDKFRERLRSSMGIYATKQANASMTFGAQFHVLMNEAAAAGLPEDELAEIAREEHGRVDKRLAKIPAMQSSASSGHGTNHGGNNGI